MLPILEAENARTTILQRIPPDEIPVPESLLGSIERLFGERILPAEAVRRILVDVRTAGDTALAKWTERLDGSATKSFRVTTAEIQAALLNTPDEQVAALQKMAERVRAFHQRQPLTSWMTGNLGGTLGQVIRPIHRVGLYVPGGTAPLPSSVLMSAIPSRVAGVP
jgi:histidinol dehydrogenase